MSGAWAGAGVFLLACAATALGALALAWLLGARPRTVPAASGRPYECGEEPRGSASLRFHPRYYVVALVFVIFDIEAAFLLPWVPELRELRGPALLAMGLFIGIVLLGWVYALAKGALRWQ